MVFSPGFVLFSATEAGLVTHLRLCGAEPCQSSGASSGIADYWEELDYKHTDAHDGTHLGKTWIETYD